MGSECSYPQETMGRTLVAHAGGDEWHRIYALERPSYLEVGEFTRGSFTMVLYDAPSHAHCVQLGDVQQDQCARLLADLVGRAKDEGLYSLLHRFFAEEHSHLVDLMDALDDHGIPYGYLNTAEGSYIAYRPARCS